MKAKFVARYVYLTTFILVFFVGLVVFKLNDYYKNEKTQIVQNKLNQQNASLKNSLSTQLGQLKNIVSSYMFQVEESKLNWVQLEALTVLAQTTIAKNGTIEVKNIYTRSGSKSERWTKEFLQKALGLKKYSGKPIHADLFQTKSGDKYMALTFTQHDLAATSGASAVTVVGEANYFQKFFDLNRARNSTQVLMTNSNVVAGHTEADYVASVTAEGKINKKIFFVEEDDIRSANLKVISYSAKNRVLAVLNIPSVLLGLILGFACILIGVLFYAFRPIERTMQKQRELEREQIFKNAAEQSSALMLADLSDVATVPKVASVNTTSDVAVDMKMVQLLQPQSVAKPLENLQLKPTAPPVVVMPKESVVLPINFEFDPKFVHVNVSMSLTSVAQEVLFHLQPACTAAGIRIEQQLDSVNEFNFDPLRFKKLFEHILLNAIEAVQDSLFKIIQVRSYDIGSRSIVEIKDSGSGIPLENREKIWHPYFTTKEKSKHQGLGLSEAQSIARRYGGDLTVESQLTGGTLLKLTMNAEEVTDTKNQEDINLDQILDLDHDEVGAIDSSAPTLDLQKEFTTTQYKLDRSLDIIEDPEIEFNMSEKSVDEFRVQIRGPKKS